MSHPDWRPRLSLAIDPQDAEALRNKIPHGIKTHVFGDLIQAIIQAPPSATITMVVVMDHDQLAGWAISTESRPVAASDDSDGPVVA